MRFDLSIRLNYEVLAASEFIFNIQAARTARQRVIAESLHINSGALASEYTDRDNHNRYLRLPAPIGNLELRYQATVAVQHWTTRDTRGIAESRVAELPPEVLGYLRPSRYCQSDRIMASAYTEFGRLEPGYWRVEAICEWVRRRTQFLPGSSRATTSALDTLIEQRGVCRDYAHLMIAYCRALNIPARFVTGLDFGADPTLGAPDFHAYVEAFLAGRWYIFDPTGIVPRLGLVRLGTGRDAADVAFATMFGPIRCFVPEVHIQAVDQPNPTESPGLAISTADEETSLMRNECRVLSISRPLHDESRVAAARTGTA